MSERLDPKAFLALSPEEQATEMGRRVPKFATLPKEEQQEYLRDLRGSLPKALPAPRALSGKPLRDVVEIATGNAPPGWLAEPAEGDPRSGQPGRTVRAIGDLFLPKTRSEAARLWSTLPIGGSVLTAPIKRTIAGGLAGAGTSLAQGRDLASAGIEGASQAASQFAGELLPFAARFGMTQRTANPLLAARETKIAHDRAMNKAITASEAEQYKADVAARQAREAATEQTFSERMQRHRADEASRAHEARAQHQERVRDLTQQYEMAVHRRKLSHERATDAAKAAYAQDLRAYAESGAASIAEAYKAQVPAFRGFPSNEAGLLDMVYGQGQARLSALYDQVMREIAVEGRGVAVEIPLRDARILRLTTTKPSREPVRGVVIATVDAAQLAEKVTGFWKTNPGIYHRAAAALDGIGIGNPSARAEYKAGQSLIQFTNDAKMLKGHRFDPVAARAAFTDLKKVDQLRRRGQGDIFRGPIAEAVNRPEPTLRLPTEPPAPPKPILPVFRRPAARPDPVRPDPPPEIEKPAQRFVFDEPMPKGVATRTLPKISFWQGAALAEIPFLVRALVSGHYSAYGVPFVLGGLTAGALSQRRFATQAPLSPLTRFAADVLPQPLAQESRRWMGKQ